MAFCSHGLKAAKDVLHKLDDKLELIIDNTLKVTGSIMKGEAWPVIEGVLKSLPYGELADKALHTAIDALADAKEIVDEKDLSKKGEMFIGEIDKYTDYKKHATLVKVASIMSSVIHGAEWVESTYDSLTQLKVVTNNAEAKKAA